MKRTFLMQAVSAVLALLLCISCVSLTASAAQPTISVGVAQASPGDSITVPITLSDNPGVVAVRIFVEYDKTVLKLTDVQNGTVFPVSKCTFNDNLQASPYTMLWMDGTAATDYSANGTLATLTFTVLDSAKDGVSSITVTYDSSSTFNVDLTDVTFTMLNGGVTVSKEEKLYTATFMVGETAISTKQYHEGEAIVKPTNPTKEGYTFKGWMPTVPSTMPANDLTFTAQFEKNAEPIIGIRNFVESRTIDYRTTITFSVDEVQNSVTGAEIHWFVDGKDVGTGESHTVKEAKKTFTVQAKYMKDGETLAETETETVKVKSGFFDKLKAFFRALFKKLPVIVQEYVAIEK